MVFLFFFIHSYIFYFFIKEKRKKKEVSFFLWVYACKAEPQKNLIHGKYFKEVDWASWKHTIRGQLRFLWRRAFNNNCHLYSMKILGGNKSYTLTINMMKKDFLIWRMCLCNSWKHPKLASKSINIQFNLHYQY